MENILYYLAIDLGGTHIRYALIHNNTLHNYNKIKYNKSQNIKSLILNLIHNISNNSHKNIKQICISSGGIIHNHTILQSKNIENYENHTFPTKIYTNSNHINLFILNDIACTLLYYKHFKNIISSDNNSLVISFGTGVGSCISIKNKIIHNSEMDDLENEYVKYQNISNSNEEKNIFCEILIKYIISYVKLLDLDIIVLYSTIIYDALEDMNLNNIVNNKLNTYHQCNIQIMNDVDANLIGSTFIQCS